jgi:hypothetical protein
MQILNFENLGCYRPTPWPRQALVWAPWPPSDIALSPINSFHQKNPKGPNIYP